MNKKEKREYDYLRNQGKFVQKNEIKIGSTVKIKRIHVPKGWQNSWEQPMNNCVGNNAKVDKVHNGGILLNEGGRYYSYPYTALEKVSN